MSCSGTYSYKIRSLRNAVNFFSDLYDEYDENKDQARNLITLCSVYLYVCMEA